MGQEYDFSKGERGKFYRKDATIVLPDNEMPSPDWHESYLKDRELAIENGTDEFVDWDTAKENILNFH